MESQYEKAIKEHKKQLLKHGLAIMAIINENSAEDYTTEYTIIGDRVEITITEVENMPFSDSIENKH